MICLRALAVLAAAVLCALAGPADATPRTGVSPTVGIRDANPRVHAIVGARVVPRPGTVIDSGTIVLRDGRIEAVGPSAKVQPPADARIWDGAGRTVYAGLIESYAHVGLPDDEALRQRADSHWNERVLAELRAAEVYQPDSHALKELRSLGFTAALIVPSAGLIHGRSALVSTADGDTPSTLIREDVAHHIALKNLGSPRDTWENVRYPASLMGSIALTRQTLMDADWYARVQANPPADQAPPETIVALAALSGAVSGGRDRRDLIILEVGDDRLLRVATELTDDFDLRVAIRGGGAEYRQLQRARAMGVPLILPVDFPGVPDVADPEDAVAVSLTSLWHWEAAPANASRARHAGIDVALTSDGLKKKAEFPERVRRAIDQGLTADDALAALTTVPARILDVADDLGTVAKGRLAHLVITDGDLLDDETRILGLWIDGEYHHMEELSPDHDLRGNWALDLQLPSTPVAVELKIAGASAPASNWKGTVLRDSIEITVSTLRLEGRRLTLAFESDSLGLDGVVRLSGRTGDSLLSGEGETPAGARFTWRATRQPAAPDTGGNAGTDSTTTAPESELTRSLQLPPFPPVGYGVYGLPDRPKDVLVRGATVWTSGPAGILEKADLLIREDRIAEVGPNLQAPSGAMVIDAAGKHVTPGLVDAHVHVGAMGGLNEWAQAVSAEVRVRDVLNAYDNRIYRHMAQGTTTVHVMHGSSNPIGGQNATIKLRWGADAEGLLLAGAAPTIKFALGENVKHSNRGPHFTTRYPQTRLGVEALIRDRLAAAREYGEHRRRDKSVRRDLELDALVEVLAGDRLVHCHSYRQDEILALIRIADDFDFTVGTFQHVLEGYKVAELIAEHGAHASTFSDWWGYKFEVIDAIPHNAALMHFVGVGVSLNSDLSNYGGRIHVDATKAVKYGGVPPEQALHMVTIEPARQLGADHLVGSLEPGKDADFVIWSHSPMSSFTRCEQTWIDGRRYFDLEDDMARRTQVEAERARLIQAVLAEGGKK
ncbi:MAG: amidohydrolase family protein [Candidatus Latescibacteria bacterium]|nr:amidohydrolase family protein [Candidatus Latescibacterota bacterium]